MKIVRYALTLLMVLMAGAAAAFQTPAVSLQGVVVELGTNNPLSNATLELRLAGSDAPARALAVSTNNGQFVFRGVRPGQYALTASRSGYLRTQYGQRGPNGVASMVTISGQQAVNVRLSMMRASAISGHVYDESGAPAVNAQLHAWKVSFKDGWRLAIPVASQMTNDLGEYRLFGLPPGEYYVSAQVEPLLHIRSPASISIAPVAPGAVILSPGPGMFAAIPDPAGLRPVPRLEWGPVYFGGTTNEYDATPLHIRPGSDLKAIEIVGKRTPTLSVTGVVMGPDGQPFVPTPAPGARLPSSTIVISGPNGERFEVLGPAPTGSASVVLTPLVNQMFHASPAITVLGGVMTVAPATPVRTNATGQFRTAALPPGAYLLTAIAADAQGQRLSGQATVNLQGGNPSNVTLALAPAWEIQGRTTVENNAGTAAPDLTTLKVRAANTVTSLADATADALSASGTFTLKNVTRGTYVVTVPPISNLFTAGTAAATAPAWRNAYVKSLRLGNIDVLENGLRLDNPPEGQLEIVIGTRGGALRGVVRDSNRAALPSVTVALIPDEASRQRFDLFRRATTDGAGSYRFEGLPPGTYKLFAWEDVEPHLWHDPAFMRVYEDLGRTVAVAEESSQEIDLTGISPLDR